MYNAENCALLGYYSACSYNSLPMFRVSLPAPSSSVKNPGRRILGFLTLEEGADRFSRNVGKELSLHSE